MTVGNPHVALNKRIATLEAELSHSNQCLQEMTGRWKESHELAEYFHNACAARDALIEKLEKNLRAAHVLRDMRNGAYRAEKKNLSDLVESLRNEFDLWAGDYPPVERAIELLEEALGKQGEQHGAPVQFPREDQSNDSSRS